MKTNEKLLEQIAIDWELSTEQVAEISGAKVHYHDYAPGSYCGSAITVWEKDGKLFEANGSHCSCFGLEDQWSPEETTWLALSTRGWEFEDSYYEWDQEQAKKFLATIKAEVL
jgi:hypothetical protein